MRERERSEAPGPEEQLTGREGIEQLSEDNPHDPDAVTGSRYSGDPDDDGRQLTDSPENGEAGSAGQDISGTAGDETEGDDREKLMEMLAGEKARAEDYFGRLVRLQADFDNYRKRVAREREDLLKYANEQLILALLPVVDNFDRALASENNDSEKLLAGIEMISRQLMDILSREGLESIPAVGQQFNPEHHEAVIKEESGNHPENSIIQELRRGYTYKGKVIRPAMVKVAG